MQRLVVVSMIAGLGCAGEDAGIAKPTFGEGAADGIDSVKFRGSLALGTPVAGVFTKNQQFDGYFLDVRAGAEVKLEITHGGSSMKLDTTLFVYGPADLDGNFSDDEIAFDNDAGYGKLSKLTTTFAAAGRYAVVIGTKTGKGRGNYRLVPTCLSGDCAPVAEIPLGGCPAVFTDKMRVCVTENVGTYDPLTPWMNFAEQCADADLLAPIYDQTCATPGAAHCLGSFEAFYEVYAPACIRDVKNTILDGFCVFGTTYQDLETMPSMHLVEHTRLTVASSLTALDRAQIISAMKASIHDDVTSIAEAFDRADSNEIFRRRWYDSSNRKAFVSFEFGSGDNSFGRVFPADSSTHVANINDGDIYPDACSVKYGPEIRDCVADLDCKPGARCVGSSDDFQRGTCLNAAADTAPNEGASCSTDVSCGASSGLLCAGLSRDPSGLCLPAWQRRGFVSEPQLAIPDNKTIGATATIYAYGLATVDMDVWLKLRISHPRATDLVITLENPATATVTIAVPAGNGVDLDIPVLGFSGDESVNGAWKLKVVDKASGQTGTIDRVELVLGSRWD